MSGSFLISYFLGFTFIAALALYFSKIHSLKFLLVGLLFFITTAIYFSFESYKGWPTTEGFDKVQVLWLDSVQPSKKDADDGAIYVWGYELNETKQNDTPWYVYTPSIKSPRSYQFPWTEEFQREVKEAKEKLKGGSFVIMENPEEPAGNKEGEEKEGEGQAKSTGFAKNYRPPVLKILAPQDVFGKD